MSFARAGLQVLGVDVDARKVGQLNEGRSYILDVSSDDVAALVQSKMLQATTDYAGLADVDVMFICVPTPFDAMRAPDLSYIVAAAEGIAPHLQRGQMVVLQSTTFPGTTQEIVQPILERGELRAGRDYDLAFSPERIDPGRSDWTVMNTPKVVGGIDATSTRRASDLLKRIGAPVVEVSSPRTAEMTKLLENIFRSVNIALVNEMALLCERMDIDLWEVIGAAKTKPYGFMPFTPSAGVGGHCIGVDPYYLTHKAEMVGYHPQVILAGRRINDNMARYAARNVIKRMLQNGVDVARSTVGVLGITFKENCPDIRNSKVADLVKELQQWGAQVVVADPWADAQEVQHEYGIELGAIDAANKVDALVVAVGHREYRDTSPAQLRALCRSDKPVLADIKALYNRAEASSAGFTVFRF